MRSPEQVIWDFVQDWLARADSDLHAATILVESPGVSSEVIGFHCQQAAEKYLKSVLVRHQIDLQAERLRVHDLVLLLKALEECEPVLADEADFAQHLFPYAVQARYPGTELGPEVPGPAEALQIAQHVRELVFAALADYIDHGRPE